jgi:predicted MFS family arabinose efflux permease
MTVSLAAVGASFAALESQPEGGATSTTVGGIGESTTFLLFSALCVVSFAFVWRLLPETNRRRSLEEIQERWVVGGDRMLEEEAA